MYHPCKFEHPELSIQGKALKRMTKMPDLSSDRVHGRALMPATGFFELAAAATAALADTAVGMLTDLTILTPKILSSEDQSAASSTVSCSIDMGGALKILSSS